MLLYLLYLLYLLTYLRVKRCERFATRPFAARRLTHAHSRIFSILAHGSKAYWPLAVGSRPMAIAWPRAQAL